jgi:thiamine biosynthesis lipoprotein ApbE
MWVTAPGAALADALSTAFMVMSDDEVRAYVAAHPGVKAVGLDARAGSEPREI